MDEFVKSLDPSLNYLTHEIYEHKIIIIVESNRNEAVCPYCKKASTRVHSVYQREFQDLPLQDKQAIILLNNRKYFCSNQECSHKTFAERFDFITSKSRKTKRLIEKILKLSTRVSSVSASQILKADMTIVCKSTICEYFGVRAPLYRKKRAAFTENESHDHGMESQRAVDTVDIVDNLTC